jgi:hypothetical protein
MLILSRGCCCDDDDDDDDEQVSEEALALSRPVRKESIRGLAESSSSRIISESEAAENGSGGAEGRGRGSPQQQ